MLQALLVVLIAAPSLSCLAWLALSFIGHDKKCAVNWAELPNTIRSIVREEIEKCVISKER